MSTMSETTPSALQDERVRAVFEAAIEWHRDEENQERMDEYDHVGFEAVDVEANGWEFPQLQQDGLIERTYKSGSSSYYRLAMDPSEAEEILDMVSGPVEVDEPIRNATVGETIDPDDLFDEVVGREDATKWLRRTVERDAQIHHLLIGPPGSGKSMILDDVSRLPGAQRVVLSGDQASAAGIRDVLLEVQPAYLVVEEIEKGSKADREALMTLCGNGYVTRTKGDGEAQRVELDTVVVAAGNDASAISPESLVDRFMLWEFEQYDRDEFVDVCTSVLPERFDDVSPTHAEYIARALHDKLGVTSVREAERIASLADTSEEVDELIEVTGRGR